MSTTQKLCQTTAATLLALLIFVGPFLAVPAFIGVFQ